MGKKVVFFLVKLAFISTIIVALFFPERLGISPEKFKGVDMAELIAVFQKIDLGHAVLWLAIATSMQLLGITANITRWRLLLAGQGLHLPFWYAAKIWFMGRAIGLFLPGTVGLDGYKFVESSLYTGEVIKCATVTAVDKLIGVVALFSLVFLTIPLGLRLFEFNPVLLAAVLTVLLVFVATAFLLLMNPRIVQVLTAALPVPAAIRGKVDKLGSAITAYSGQRRTLIIAVLLGLCGHLGICLMYFSVTMAVMDDMGVMLDVLFASPIVIVFSIIAPTVSGVGVREGVFSIVLGAKYGAAEALLSGHLGLWGGELIPFALSIPLLLFAGRPNREKFLEDVESVRAEAAAESQIHGVDLAPEAVAAYRRKLTLSALAGLFAGLVGGALIGLAEAGWHASTLTGVAELNVYWWSPLVYGICFAGLGLGCAAALVFLYLLFDRFASAAATFGLSLGGVLAVAVVVIGRFRYKRDVLAEHALSMGENIGVLGAAIGIALAAALIGGLIVHIGRGGWRRGVIAGVGAYVVLVLVGAGIAATNTPKVEALAFQPTRNAHGPNIFLIAVDTLRADYLGVYNASALPETPHIDALAQDSVVFDNTFAQSSWTKASFGTIFSGMYPEAHTATGKASALPDEITTIAEALNEGGYFTKGYSNNPNITSIFNYDQGFVDYVDLKPDLYFGATPSSEKMVLYDVLRKVVQKIYARLGGRIVITDFYQPADVITETGLDWLDSAERPDNAPFMLFLHYMDPHDPFRDPERPGRGYARAQMPNPDPKKYKEAFIRSYVYEIEYLDQWFGEFIAGLKERGLYDNSLILFTADHGEEFHEHGGWWHGLSLYEEQIAIPLMVKLPEQAAAGTRYNGLARHVDIAPTLARIAEMQPEQAWQGRPLFDGTAPAADEITHIYSHLDFEGIQLKALRTQTEKLIEANEGNKRGYAPLEYYNLETDPGEQENLADEADSALPMGHLRKTIDDMRQFILENAAEPSITEEGMQQSQEELESLGYL